MFKKHRFLGNDYNLRQLMRLYSLIMVIIITLLSCTLSLFYYFTYIDGAKKNLDAGLAMIDDSVSANQRETANMTTVLSNSDVKIKNLDAYFQNSVSDYVTYSLDTSTNGRQYYFLPDQSASLFSLNSTLNKIVLNLSGEKQYFVATSNKPGGYKTKKVPASYNHYTFHRSMTSDASYQVSGTFYAEFQTAALRRQLRNTTNGGNLQVLVLSELGVPVFYGANQNVAKKDQQKIQKRIKKATDQGIVEDPKSYLTDTNIVQQYNDNGYLMVVFYQNKAVRNTALRPVIYIVLFTIVFYLLLIFSLYLTFNRYNYQLNRIIKSMSAIGKGSLDSRIEVINSKDELGVLSIGVNQMLDQINQYIYQIYQLEIAQKDANMKALQAQINPHFLYNTLEYIRMYAVSEGQDELAEVVYNFASLLRNNTDQSKYTTLEKELTFTEKYIYLYQMRFPNQIAYNVKLDARLRELQIPKFTIQPLVENYFVHGIDFEREDNAISIDVSYNNGVAEIRIRDNGQGISIGKMAEIKASLHEEKNIQSTSIGLVNVYNRMHGVFGNDFDMDLQSNEMQGLTVVLRIKEGEQLRV